MKTYTYKFIDRTTNDVEVSDELYAVIAEMDYEERCNNKTETRRHISLDYLKSRGIEFQANSDQLIELIKREDASKLHKAVAQLSDKQRKLLEKVFIDDMSLREIAAETDVSHQALSQQMATIYKKLKKLF